MKTLSDLTKTIAAHRNEYTNKYHVSSVGIFGSYVRNEAREDSDLDILVSFSKEPSLLKLVALENYFSDLLDVKVDLVPKADLKPKIGKQVLAELKKI